jgi:outer membrane lipoprotein-sorting protein
MITRRIGIRNTVKNQFSFITNQQHNRKEKNMDEIFNNQESDGLEPDDILSSLLTDDNSDDMIELTIHYRKIATPFFLQELSAQTETDDFTSFQAFVSRATCLNDFDMDWVRGGHQG